MTNQAYGELVDDVEQGRQIKNVFDEAVHRSWSPRAVPVTSQIERIHAVMLAQRARDPVPVAGVIQAAVDQHERGFSVLSVVPELQFQPVGVKKMRDWLHEVWSSPVDRGLSSSRDCIIAACARNSLRPG